jgi:hypothetical protein
LTGLAESPELRCPKCLSRDIVSGSDDGLLDALMSAFDRFPKVCRACGKRFYVREARPPRG